MLRLASLLAAAAALACAQQKLPGQLEGVGVTEHLGARLDLSKTFTAENGYPVALSKYFNQRRPVILNFVYYECPMLCNLLLNGQVQALKDIPGTPGKDFEIVTISINPAEGFDLAQRKRASYLESYGRPAPGWHFLVDRDGNVKKLAEQAGFHYRYDEQNKQFAHAAAILILTPDGVISRYLYGIEFKPRDLRLALAEASDSKVGSTVDHLLLFCYHYDPKAGGYVLFAGNVMRAGGVLIVLALGFLIWRLRRSETTRLAEAK